MRRWWSRERMSRRRKEQSRPLSLAAWVVANRSESFLERDDERMSFGEGEGSDEIWMCVPLCVFCVWAGDEEKEEGIVWRWVCARRKMRRGGFCAVCAAAEEWEDREWE